MGSTLEEKFLSAYDAHSDALFRHCFFRVYSREDAKDLVQEVFCRTWSYLTEGKQIDNLRAFLYRVAHNLIVDASRKKKSLSLDQLIEEGFSPKDESFRNTEIHIQIKEALSKLESLEEPYRTVLLMRFVDDLSPKEIASILGVTENAVSVRIHRGTQKLGTTLNKSNT